MTSEMSNDPFSVPKYLYVDANPINGWDPSGHTLIGTLAGATYDAGAAIASAGVTAGALGEAGLVVSSLSYMSASMGLAIEMSAGDEAGIAEMQKFQQQSLYIMEASAAVVGVGFGLSVVGGAVMTSAAALGAIGGYGGYFSTGMASFTNSVSSPAVRLQEQFMLAQIQSDPGAGDIVPLVMNNPRWPAGSGWMKMQQEINGVTVHYLYNAVTHAVDDIKFM